MSMIAKEKIGSFFDFTTKNFLLLSVFMLIVYSVIGYDFTTFYLSAFEPSLQNFIQYSDIPSISALASVIFAPTLLGVLFAALVYGEQRRWSFKWRVVVFLFAVFIYVSPEIYGFYHIDNSKYTPEEYLWTRGSYSVLIITAIFSVLFTAIFDNILLTLFVISTILLTCTATYAYGSGIRDKRISPILYDVFMKKDGDSRVSILGAKLVLSLSHHTIFYLRDRAIIVQTGDIEEMTAHRLTPE